MMDSEGGYLHYYQTPMDANLRHMVGCAARPNPAPQDATFLTRAFDKVMFPKAVRLLASESLVLRQKAVLAAEELLATGESAAQVISAGGPRALVTALSDSDALVRMRAATALGAAAQSPVGSTGANALLACGAPAALLAALDDPVMEVKDAAYGALIAAAKRSMGVQAAIVGQGALSPLIAKAGREAAAEQPLRMAAALELVRCCLAGRNPAATPELIAAHAIPALTHMLGLWPGPLTAERATAKEGAASVVHLLCTPDEGKEAAVMAGAVPLLYDLLLVDRRSARAVASGALMAITVANSGKRAFELTAAEGGAALVSLLQNEAAAEEEVMLNVLQLTANVAEYPLARGALQDADAPGILAQIQQAHPNAVVRRHAADALRGVGFNHAPYEQLAVDPIGPSDEAPPAFTPWVGIHRPDYEDAGPHTGYEPWKPTVIGEEPPAAEEPAGDAAEGGEGGDEGEGDAELQGETGPEPGEAEEPIVI